MGNEPAEKTAKPPSKALAKKNLAASSPETSRAGKTEKRGGLRSTTRVPGWGGPAKGAGKIIPTKKLDGPGPGRGKFSVAGEARKEQTYRRVETLMELLWEIANNRVEQTASRIAAANHLLNRIQGLPVQTVISTTTDDFSMMTDAELATDLERRSGKVRAFREAVMGTDLPGEPNSVDD
jgi:hypothetical protein